MSKSNVLRKTADSYEEGRLLTILGPPELLKLFNTHLQNDDVQDFDIRWDQALLVAMYEQENVRNNEPPSYSRLKTRIARRQIDQTMTTRNFRARNETVERGTETKSQKGEKRV